MARFDNYNNNNHHRGLTRFVVCLFIWLVVTQCDTNWIWDKVDSVVDFNLEGSEGSEASAPSGGLKNPDQQDIEFVSDDEEDELSGITFFWTFVFNFVTFLQACHIFLQFCHILLQFCDI